MALGARRRDVLRLIVLHGMKMSGIGLAAGIIGALAVARLMASLVYQTSTTDFATFITVGVFLAMFILLASLVPSARHAHRSKHCFALRAIESGD